MRDEDDHAGTHAGDRQGTTRRTLLRSAVWAAPVVAAATAIPLTAASAAGQLAVSSRGYDPSQAWGAFAAMTATPAYTGALTNDMISFSDPVTVTRWVAVDSGRVLQLFFMPDDRTLPGVRATFLVPGYSALPVDFGTPA